MLTPILSAVLGAALSAAPSPTTSLPSTSTTPHVLGICQTGYVLESGENYGDDVSPMTDAELYFYHYTSEAFRKTHAVDSSLNNPMQAQVEVLVPPKYGELLDKGNPASGDVYRQGAEGKHLYRYMPDKGHETDSDQFRVRVTLKSVQVDIQYHMEAVPFGYRPDESCPREIWKISQIDVKGLDGVELASTGFTPEGQLLPHRLLPTWRKRTESASNGNDLNLLSSRKRRSSAFGGPPTAAITEVLSTQESKKQDFPLR